jgi:hypothetical protein
VVALERSHLVRADECKAELAVVDTLAAENAAGELDGRVLVDLDPASVVDLHREHPAHYCRRPLPVSSACSR